MSQFQGLSPTPFSHLVDAIGRGAYGGDMKGKKDEKYQPNAPVVRQETFSDGSRLSELADGCFIL